MLCDNHPPNINNHLLLTESTDPISMQSQYTYISE